tara:strand:- start:99 stop:506 length:408 start_codon:yes stop_codon:yes gene_type:complete
MSLNKALIIGRLGKDTELKYTPSGKAVCSFSVATSEKYKDKQGNSKQDVQWHNIVVWGKLAELCNQYLSKGSQCFVEGKLATRSWEDQQGNKKYTTEVIASAVQFLGSKTEKTTQENPYQDVKTESNFIADDIPF